MTTQQQMFHFVEIINQAIIEHTNTHQRLFTMDGAVEDKPVQDFLKHWKITNVKKKEDLIPAVRKKLKITYDRIYLRAIGNILGVTVWLMIDEFGSWRICVRDKDFTFMGYSYIIEQFVAIYVPDFVTK